METVIYSANLLWAFISPFASILLTGLLGIASFGAVFFQRKQGTGARIAMGISGIVLLSFVFATASLAYISITSGAETTAIWVNDKNIGTATSDNGGTSKEYILSTTAGLVSYDIIVNSRTYNLVQVNSCYQVTYYKYKSLIDSTPDTDMYHRIQVITRMETVDSTACR